MGLGEYYREESWILKNKQEGIMITQFLKKMNPVSLTLDNKNSKKLYK